MERLAEPDSYNSKCRAPWLACSCGVGGVKEEANGLREESDAGNFFNNPQRCCFSGHSLFQCSIGDIYRCVQES